LLCPVSFKRCKYTILNGLQTAGIAETSLLAERLFPKQNQAFRTASRGTAKVNKGDRIYDQRDMEKQKPYHCHKYIDMAF